MQGSSVIAASIEPERLEAEPSTPKRLGKYLLVRRLARGGMGDVHLAKLPGELGFEKLLVIKTIRAELAADPRFVELFAREAKTAVGLSHPNITPIYELGRAEDGTLYTAMGWVDGPSLAQWIDRLRSDRRKGAGFELGATLLITRELLDGLAHAHSRDQGRPSLVHRDITPRNVLVDRSGRVQIVDFGIAKPVDASEVGGTLGSVGGSVGYMAPEQARGEPVDPRADVFSVGCVLFELLTLEQAFPREGVWMCPDLGQLPPELRGLLERALAIDPARRFADASEFLRGLASVQAELAPTYSTPDLALALRERFATRGWADVEARRESGATPTTHVTPVHRTIAFATRGTQPDAELAAEQHDELSEEIAVPLDPPAAARRRLHPMIWAVSGAAVALLLGVLALELVDREPSGPRSSPSSVTPEPEPVIEPASQSATRRATPPSLHIPPDPALPEVATTRTITVTPTPAQAELWLDGVRVEGPPFELELEGPRSLELRAPGHQPRTLELDPEGPELVQVELDPLGEGQLSVLAPSVAWAEVWLDGEKLGSTPLTDLAVIEGRHKLEVRCSAEVCEDERILTRKTLQIRAGRRTRVTAAQAGD